MLRERAPSNRDRPSSIETNRCHLTPAPTQVTVEPHNELPNSEQIQCDSGVFFCSLSYRATMAGSCRCVSSESSLFNTEKDDVDEFFKWLLAGIIGAAIGGAVWVAVGYYAESEVGYIAWGIGFLAGLGVRMTADDHDVGVMSGIAAVLAAAGIIVLAKYMVVSLLVGNAMAEMDVDSTLTPMDMTVGIADDVVAEWEAEGKTITWKAGMTIDDATTQADYPADVWAEASKRWNEVPPAEQQTRIEEATEARQQFAEMISASIKDDAFEASFNGFDLLWFGLAAFTAFRIAGGGNDE